MFLLRSLKTKRIVTKRNLLRSLGSAVAGWCSLYFVSGDSLLNMFLLCFLAVLMDGEREGDVKLVM